MKQFILFVLITVIAGLTVTAQEGARAKSSGQGSSEDKIKASKQSQDQSLTLESGTQLSAELLTSLDVSKAKPGDEFKVRTLKPVMDGKKKVVDKGTVLVGHVIEATRAEGKKGVSQLKLGFDELRNKNLTAPFSATIEQINKVGVNHQSQLNEMSSIDLSGSTSSRSGAAGSSNGSGGGGLLGGVTGTVGNTVGGTLGNTTGTVGNSVGGITAVTQQIAGDVLAVSSDSLNQSSNQAKGLISISSISAAEANGEASGSTTLSLSGRNVKVEKGSVFLLRTDKSISLSGNRQQ